MNNKIQKVLNKCIPPYLKLLQQLIGNFIWCTDNNLVNVTASQYTKNPLMQTHDWKVASLVTINNWICMKTNYKIVSFFFCCVKKIQQANMEKIKGTCGIRYSVTRLGFLSIWKLHNPLGGWKEMGHTSPGALSSWIRTGPTHLVRVHICNRRWTPIKMFLSHQKHSAHKVCGGHSGRTFTFFVSPSCFHHLICVSTISSQRDVISMNAEITGVFVKSFDGRHVRRVHNNFIDPLDRFAHFESFLLVKNWRAFVPFNFLIGVNTHNKNIAHCFGLAQGVRVTEMDHIKASIRPNTGLFTTLLWRVIHLIILHFGS